MGRNITAGRKAWPDVYLPIRSRGRKKAHGAEYHRRPEGLAGCLPANPDNAGKSGKFPENPDRKSGQKGRTERADRKGGQKGRTERADRKGGQKGRKGGRTRGREKAQKSAQGG
jgi:hypothetical protein